jgi:uncharacterized protein (TIGR00159 family)
VFEGLKHLFALDRPFTEILRDLFDILIVAFIVYRALLVLKGTRAMQMGIGFVAFGLLYLMAKYAELATLLSVLSWLASSAILVIVVVFQNDIRRALIRVGSKAWLTRAHDAQERVIEEVVTAAQELARHRMGAIMCIERDANVLEFVKNDGIELDSLVTSELLVSMFIPESVNKTHDGAVLIRDLRIARAGLFFPMPESTRVADPTLGSRHRAAIGITEETDALVVVVSEERGTITLVFKDGTMVPSLSGASLREALLGLLGRTEQKRKRERLMQRVARGLGRVSVSDSFAVDSLLSGKVAGDKAKADKPRPLKAEASDSWERESHKPKSDKSKPDKLRSQPSKAEAKAVDASTDDGKARASSLRQSTPPPASEKQAADKHPAEKKKTKRSGSFTAVATDDKPATPRLSVPMPSSKDKPTATPRSVASDDAAPPPSVTKPMAQTELPTMGGDEP